MAFVGSSAFVSKTAVSRSSSTCLFGAQLSSAKVARRSASIPKMAAAGEAMPPEDMVPDMNKRNLMNLLLVGAIGFPGTAILGSWLWFLYPSLQGGGGGGTVAKDALGNSVKKSVWIQTQGKGARKLVQGLKGDATYLIVNEEGNDLEAFGVNAVCTHLGCVVPWNVAEKKFMCPCHGSQYDKNGRVVRGPAPLSLALAHVEETESGEVVLKPWTETDFRTGDAPWWKP